MARIDRPVVSGPSPRATLAMMRTVRANPDEEAGPPQDAAEGGLADLIELERRVEADLAAARRDAEQGIEAARHASQQLLAGGDGDLAAALSSLREESRRQCEAELRAIESQGAQEAAAFDAVGEAGLERLARLVAARLAGRDDPA